jgi:hypothetical protein
MTPRWANITKLYDVTFLPIEEDAFKTLEGQGMKRGVIEKERFPQLSNDANSVKCRRRSILSGTWEPAMLILWSGVL